MNNLVLYLSSQPQIQEAVLVMGTNTSEWLACDICRSIHLKHFSIYIPTRELSHKMRHALERFRAEEPSHVPENMKILTKKELLSYQPVTDNPALIFDSPADEKEIMELCFLRPYFLIGALNKDKMNAFHIWETYRKISRHIYIVSWKQDEEVMNWSHNDRSDIELSIIFPVYNVASYLSKCIETVTGWKADYVEYLFVDDGSPDNSADLIAEYAKKDPRIQLLRKINGGCASARQFGLEHARGRYVGFIDPDDYIDPSMFRKLLSRALSGSYEISYCGYNELYENTGKTREIADSLKWPYNEGTSDPIRMNELLAFLRVAIWRGIYLRDMIDRNKIHFYTDLRRFDDLPFKIEAFSKARSIVAVPEYLYYYRLARPGQDISADDERLYVHFPIFQYLDEFLRKSSDRRQLDYLQLVKVHTHRYALEKIQPQFVKEYCKRAKKDIHSNYKFLEGGYIIRRLGTKEDMHYYIALYWGCNCAVRFMLRPKKEKKSKNKEAISRLRKLVNIENE